MWEAQALIPIKQRHQWKLMLIAGIRDKIRVYDGSWRVFFPESFLLWFNYYALVTLFSNQLQLKGPISLSLSYSTGIY